MPRLPHTLKARLELAGLPTPLEHAAAPKEWLVPQDIALRGDRLYWRPNVPSATSPYFTHAYTKRTPGPGLLEQFVALMDASDDAILQYARHWGVLMICVHGLPAVHSDRCRPLAVSGRGRYPYWEPLASWRQLACHARQILELAAATYNGEIVGLDRLFDLDLLPIPARPSGVIREPERMRTYRPERVLHGFHERKNVIEYVLTERMEDFRPEQLAAVHPNLRPSGARGTERLLRQRAFVSHAVNSWLSWGRARPYMDWEGPTPTIDLTTGRFAAAEMYADRLAGALALQLAYAVASSKGVATCYACGRFYTPTRRPAAGRRSFCPTCGVRAAWRTSKRIARGKFGHKQK